jgi:hypothetical protein
MRSISRCVNAVAKLLVDAGTACAAFHDEIVRDVKAERVQCDEIWSFSYAKAKNVKHAKAAPEGSGDVWTLDRHRCRLQADHLVARRRPQSAHWHVIHARS